MVENEDKPKDKITSEPTLLERTEAMVKRMEEATAKAKEENDRKEKMMARDMLGGTTDAGQAPEPKKEITNEEYAKKIMAGEVPDVGPAESS